MTITQQQKQFNVLLIGDNCKDVYQYGTVDRISPEAPVPVFVPTYTEERDGMAGNVFNNLEALGCNVNYLFGETSTKTRLIDQRSKQQLLRIDNDVISDPLVIESEMPPYDAIVISDYNKGTLSYELIEELIRDFPGPVFIDTKKQDLARFHGAYVKINELEYNRKTSVNDKTIITYGDKGAVYKQYFDEEIFPTDIVDVADVCGAGDTFIAALAYQFLKTQSIQDAIVFANKAASITVQHTGNYTPTLKEIQ